MAHVEEAGIEVDPEVSPELREAFLKTPGIAIPSSGDSAVGDVEDQISAFTASLTSSVANFPTQHGRRYHAFRSGVYPWPNDEPELDRLDMMHCMMVKALGDKLHLAPIPSDVKRVLDCGTGTGIWAIEMADLHPTAEVIGNDLSPVQPAWVPPNLKFEVDDVESDWAHRFKFDFIFIRFLAFSIKDWPKLVRTAYDNLEPGGWIELQDYDFHAYSDDGSLTPDSPFSKWMKDLYTASDKVGREPNPGPFLEDWVKQAGFQQVVHQKFRLPLGPWPKDKHLKTVGMFNLLQILDGIEGISLRPYIDVLGWRKEEVEVLLAQVRSALKSKALHAQIDLHVVYGQKPHAAQGQPNPPP